MRRQILFPFARYGDSKDEKTNSLWPQMSLAVGSPFGDIALQERSCKVGCRIDQPEYPAALAVRSSSIEAESSRPVEVGSIRPCLVPSPNKTCS